MGNNVLFRKSHLALNHLPNGHLAYSLTNGTSRPGSIVSRMIPGGLLPPVPPSFFRDVPPSPEFLQYLRLSELLEPSPWARGPGETIETIDVGWNQDDNVKIGLDGIVCIARLFDEGALFIFGPARGASAVVEQNRRYVVGARFALNDEEVVQRAIRLALDRAMVTKAVIVLPELESIRESYGPELERRMRERLLLPENVYTFYAVYETIAPGQQSIVVESLAASVSAYSTMRHESRVRLAGPTTADVPGSDLAAAIENIETGRVGSPAFSNATFPQLVVHGSHDVEISDAELLALIQDMDEDPLGEPLTFFPPPDQETNCTNADPDLIDTLIRELQQNGAPDLSDSIQPVAPGTPRTEAEAADLMAYVGNWNGVSSPPNATEPVAPQTHDEDAGLAEMLLKILEQPGEAQPSSPVHSTQPAALQNHAENAELETLFDDIQELQSSEGLSPPSLSLPVASQPVAPQPDALPSSRLASARPRPIRLRPIAPRLYALVPNALQPLYTRPLHHPSLLAAVRGIGQTHGMPHPAAVLYNLVRQPGFLLNTGTWFPIHPTDVALVVPYIVGILGPSGRSRIRESIVEASCRMMSRRPKAPFFAYSTSTILVHFLSGVGGMITLSDILSAPSIPSREQVRSKPR